ncbi:hypothetical protein DFH06DRAFT_1122153 [Mycena polygramma]|nr:hypothetical protein DFH06DRAFT_1122153 [Mycena polygramma]
MVAGESGGRTLQGLHANFTAGAARRILEGQANFNTKCDELQPKYCDLCAACVFLVSEWASGQNAYDREAFFGSKGPNQILYLAMRNYGSCHVMSCNPDSSINGFNTLPASTNKALYGCDVIQIVPESSQGQGTSVANTLLAISQQAFRLNCVQSFERNSKELSIFNPGSGTANGGTRGGSSGKDIDKLVVLYLELKKNYSRT